MSEPGFSLPDQGRHGWMVPVRLEGWPLESTFQATGKSGNATGNALHDGVQFRFNRIACLTGNGSPLIVETAFGRIAERLPRPRE